MASFKDLSPRQFRATVDVLRGIIRDEQAVAAGRRPSSDKDNTQRIVALIKAEGMSGWNRKTLGSLMNRMRRVLADEKGEVGCFPNGQMKTGPAQGAEGVGERMRALGLV
jgi:hypothetical protein